MYKAKNYAFKSQIKFFSNKLEKHGINSDTVDLPHVLDRTLTFKENKSVLHNYIGKDLYRPKIKAKVSSIDLFERAENNYKNRSILSRTMDDRKRAKNVYSPETLTKKQYSKWVKNPNRNDIEGIDAEGRFY